MITIFFTWGGRIMLILFFVAFVPVSIRHISLYGVGDWFLASGFTFVVMFVSYMIGWIEGSRHRK